MDVLKKLSISEIARFMNDDETSEKKMFARIGQKYYDGDHDIRHYRIFYYDANGDLQEDTTRANVKIPHPFLTELVDQCTQLILSGDERIVRADDPALQTEMDDYFNYNEDFTAELSELLTGCQAKGFEYMYAYKTKNDKTAFMCADSIGVIEVRARDTDANTDYVIYWYVDRIEKGKKVIKRIQVWDKENVTFYVKASNGQIALDNSQKINPLPHTTYTKDGDKATYFETYDIGREIGRTMKGTPFQKAMNNGIRIARTEGHRIQVAANLDAMQAAKERGADVVKQWDATLDETTRERHRELDGQIREIDEYFEYSGGTVKAPGMFGNPAEDCNCRCAVLTRARWALDEEELKTLQERAKYFGLDKTKSFEEFREKYLNATQQTSYDGIPKTWGMLQEGDKAIDTNPQKSNINCVNCTIAYEMRERGYAVVAGDVNKKLRDDPFCGWVNPNVQKVKTNDPYSEIVNSAKQWGAGSRGQITVLYKERRGIYSTSTKRQGHSFNIKNVDGNIQFVDSQKGKIYNENEIKKILGQSFFSWD